MNRHSNYNISHLEKNSHQSIMVNPTRTITNPYAVNMNTPVNSSVIGNGGSGPVNIVANTANMVSQHSGPHDGERHNATSEPVVMGRDVSNIGHFVGQPLIKRVEENYPVTPKSAFFIRNTAAPTLEIATKDCQLNIVTFNCKNINTCELVLNDLGKFANIVLIQEYWLFDCNLHKLKEVNSYYTRCGKAVDTGDPVLPVKMRRGYGGTAILWKHDIDHLIQVLSDGGNRIQCVELKGEKLLLLVSAYMPCRGLSDNIDDYSDCLDQLREIVSKYSASRIIVLSGNK